MVRRQVGALINPSNAFGWFWSGFLRLFAGSTETAIEHFEKSLRLDPRTPLRANTATDGLRDLGKRNLRLGLGRALR